LKAPAFIRGPAAPDWAGGFDWSIALGDSAIVLWLGQACPAFTGAPGLDWPEGAGFALVVAFVAWRLGLHRRPPLQPASAFLVRSVLLAPVVTVLLFAGRALAGPQVSPAAALWFASTVAVLCFAFRLGFWAARAAVPDQPLEIIRWLIIAGAGVALLLPYYGRDDTGSGDAYWYVVMLADVAVQFRHGVFPVWVGQSEYAFNGAVSPLRLAPLFQYAGGTLDLLTAHLLEPLALKNALLCLLGLAIAASSYLSLRAILPRRPGIACLLALLWLTSPCTLVPLAGNSMYMQFAALLFLPPLALGCWRLWQDDDVTSRVLIVMSLAGLMLSHTPTALWGGLLAGGMVLGQLLTGRDWVRHGRLAAGMAGLFLVGGAFPIGSALTIDHPVILRVDPAQVLREIAQAFPANLGPIRSRGDLQVGGTLAVLTVLAGLFLAAFRPRGGVATVVALAVLVLLAFPVPGITTAIWSHLPGLMLSINNTSATGRLFEFLALFGVFAFAQAAADDRISRRPWLAGLMLAALLGGAAWSATQVARIFPGASASPTEQSNAYLRPENAVLTRFSYASFAEVPAYASHAHMEPLLENRLLDRATRTVITANADAAAPRLRPDSAPETLPRLAQSGVWIAANSDRSRVYRLTPPIRLESGRSYAMRIDFFHPEIAGELQLRNADLFRDYLLPDSGEGMGLRPSPLAFGALPSSSGVAALRQSSGEPAVPQLLLVLPKYAGDRFEFARFRLYTYAPGDLPIRVVSWVPYRAEMETAIPAFLETPRIWQKGWRAAVNGRPVATEVSPQNLVMIPVEAGANSVLLTFHPPIWLAAWFWLCLAGWTVLLAWITTRVAGRAFAGASAGPPDAGTAR
jgi:hypothetical protein